MTRARSVYKKNVRRFNFEQDKIRTAKLLSARFSNAELYWKMLKEGDSKKSPTGINIDSFTEYFKAINNPESRFFQADDDIINFNQYIVDGEMKIMFSELDLPFTKEDVLRTGENIVFEHTYTLYI